MRRWPKREYLAAPWATFPSRLCTRWRMHWLTIVLWFLRNEIRRTVRTPFFMVESVRPVIIPHRTAVTDHWHMHWTLLLQIGIQFISRGKWLSNKTGFAKREAHTLSARTRILGLRSRICHPSSRFRHCPVFGIPRGHHRWRHRCSCIPKYKEKRNPSTRLE